MSKSSVIVHSGCLPRGHCYCNELVRFVQEPTELTGSANVEFQIPKRRYVPRHLKPEAALVGFLFNCSKFCNEIGFGFTSARRTVVGCHGTRRANNLPNRMASFERLWQTSTRRNHIEPKSLSPVLQFFANTKFEVRVSNVEVRFQRFVIRTSIFAIHSLIRSSKFEFQMSK